jgi:hypothetical protein
VRMSRFALGDMSFMTLLLSVVIDVPAGLRRCFIGHGRRVKSSPVVDRIVCPHRLQISTLLIKGQSEK